MPGAGAAVNMLKLKFVPRFTRILSSSGGRLVSRGFAADAGGGGDDGDFYTQYLSQAPARNERSQGYGRQGPRFDRGGGSGYAGGGRRGRGGRGGGRGGSARRDRYGIDDDHPAPPVEFSEEDLKARKELDEKMAAEEALEAKRRAEAEESEDEDDDGEVRSIYAGFIDPKYDDVIKEQKMLLKRLRYKDKTPIPDKFAGEDEEEDLSYLDHDSDEEERAKRRGRGQRRGAANAKEEDSDDEIDDASESEDEVDEEEYELMEELNSKEFEQHLKHRAHAKKVRQEYEDRIAALGDKAEDMEEVKKVQKLMMRKWRAHYLMPRMVTPKEKEEMWEKHKENPEEWTVDKLAEEYEVCKARVHAILFLWDIRKQQGESQTAEEETKTYLENLCFDDAGKPCLPPHMGEDKWVTTWNTRPNYKIMPADWEGSVQTEEQAIEEASAKEEAMMLEEFVRRLEFNKLQIAGLILKNKHDRRRPPGGWTYLVEKLGSQGKRGKWGGFKFVATADGKHRKLNTLEKLVLKREAVRPRKRIL